MRSTMFYLFLFSFFLIFDVCRDSSLQAARSTTVAPALQTSSPGAEADNMERKDKDIKIDLHNSHFIGSGSLLDMLGDSEGEEEGEFDAELEAFKMKLELSQMPQERPKPVCVRV
jgi:hypothetical protein